MKKFSYSLRDIIFVALIGIFCGAIFFGTDIIYNFLKAGLTAIGFGPFANELLLGLWMIAGPLGAVVTKKIGASTITETLGGAVEALMGGQFGAGAILSGLIQGIGNELGFAISGYRSFGKMALLLSTITSTIVTFAWSLLSEGYMNYKIGYLSALFAARFISIGFFAGALAYWINKLFDRSGLDKE